MEENTGYHSEIIDKGTQFVDVADDLEVDPRKEKIDQFTGANPIDSGNEEWNKSFLKEYEIAEGSLLYRIDRDQKLISEETLFIESKEDKRNPLDVKARLESSLAMHVGLRSIYVKIAERVKEGVSDKELNNLSSKVNGLQGAENIDLFVPEEFFGNKEKKKSFSRTRAERFANIGRGVLTAVYNQFNVGNEMSRPSKISKEDWEDEFFRAMHPALQRKAKRCQDDLKKITEDLEKAVMTLNSVSIGANLGSGGDVALDKVIKAVSDVTRTKVQAVLHSALSRMYTKMAQNHSESSLIRQKLKNGYEESLRESLNKREEFRTKKLAEKIYESQKKYEDIKKPLQYFIDDRGVREFEADKEA